MTQQPGVNLKTDLTLKRLTSRLLSWYLIVYMSNFNQYLCSILFFVLGIYIYICSSVYLFIFILQVRINVTNHNLAILIYLMRLVKALIDNPHISLEPYLHLLVPTVITCVLNRQLCAKPITDNHWALRDFAAKQLVTLCNRHNTSSNELYGRVTRELSRALCNWIDGGSASNSSTETCMKLSNPNVPIIVKSELSKYTDDEKSDETKLCKYENDHLTNSLTNTTLTTITTTTSHNNSSSINSTTV
ncbi:Transcription initiation factor TFIID subunit 6 [Schistosoma haematobium]|uniref:Transcription initiation factor TFIID subunit 6 n=1 Tax=Schistosoma haematobium TaxID=6185 RepID=A0A922LSU5_SCHHA|nr:Transcription initiation factor TFIID subunit 6 [Schistosoma haematobium]KAH9592679.1 Transcription initiation factor TFIID subunit 6 [Schistosoma haematobium]